MHEIGQFSFVYPDPLQNSAKTRRYKTTPNADRSSTHYQGVRNDYQEQREHYSTPDRWAASMPRVFKTPNRLPDVMPLKSCFMLSGFGYKSSPQTMVNLRDSKCCRKSGRIFKIIVTEMGTVYVDKYMRISETAPPVNTVQMIVVTHRSRPSSCAALVR